MEEQEYREMKARLLQGRKFTELTYEEVDQLVEKEQARHAKGFKKEHQRALARKARSLEKTPETQITLRTIKEEPSPEESKEEEADEPSLEFPVREEPLVKEPLLREDVYFPGEMRLKEMELVLQIKKQDTLAFFLGQVTGFLAGLGLMEVFKMIWRFFWPTVATLANHA